MIMDSVSLVEKYIADQSKTDPGWQWALDNNMFQKVSAAEICNGNTFSVHRILADPTHTIIIFSIKGEKPRYPSGMHFYFNNQRFITSYGGSTTMNNGVFIGSIETEPIPDESGTINVRMPNKIGNTVEWLDISFPVSQVALSKLTKVVPINHKIVLPEGLLLAESLIISPVQTVINLRYKGRVPGFYVCYEHQTDSGTALKTPNVQLSPSGLTGQGQEVREYWEETYALKFQRLDPAPVSAILKLSGFVYNTGETLIPLGENKSILTPDDRTLTVGNINIDGANGTASLRYDVPYEQICLSEVMQWKVLDNKGDQHFTHHNGNSNIELKGESLLQLKWTLPTGRKAVSLFNPGYWEYVDNLGEIKIDIST